MAAHREYQNSMNLILNSLHVSRIYTKLTFNTLDARVQRKTAEISNKHPSIFIIQVSSFIVYTVSNTKQTVSEKEKIKSWKTAEILNSIYMHEYNVSACIESILSLSPFIELPLKIVGSRKQKQKQQHRIILSTKLYLILYIAYGRASASLILAVK